VASVLIHFVRPMICPKYQYGQMVLDGGGLFEDFEGRAGRCSLPGLQVKLVAVPLERPHR